MDKKFMKIKKFTIPVMTVIIMTSQLMGCASVSSNEMLELLEAGESIEIEVALPAYYEEEQGKNILSEWTELGSQSNYKEYRLAFDDIFYNYSFDTGMKNGPAYIDLEGNWTNNSTLYYAMLNKVFAEKLASTDATDALTEAIQENYVDIEEPSTTEARAVAINAYFSLFNDHEVGYANPNSTLTRGEFLAGLAKADTPVNKELANSPEFLASIGKQTDLTLLAELADEHSYLNSSDKSLDAVTFNGTISKAEAVYTIVQRYFSDEYSKVTGKEEAYADTKNAGNIALRAGYINEEENKYPDKWKAYTLSSMLQNPDKGMDESFYKSYVVAKQLGLVEGTETNYDEAITKQEAIDLILKAYEAIAKRDGYSTDQQDGLNEGSVINRGDQEEIESGSGSNVEVEGEIVEGTALTQEEIDEFKSSAETDIQKENIEIYEIITSGGTWIDGNGTPYDKIVGTPSNDGYCKLDGRTGTVYYDEAAWKEVAKQRVAENYQEPVWDDTDVSSW